ncbi:hypothetical protein [Rhodanobacter denitrificans]|uniref:hypothetical protein n=2 Tax=Rhodanobacteraceae TaxID=1775411 RepID=UPI001F1DED15|nr:hypothetical protein [Rhodanobacter denitrificans]UJJ58241.1 hypothetical protein LRK55_16535 [Rhodanobacter denitrificans]
MIKPNSKSKICSTDAPSDAELDATQRRAESGYHELAAELKLPDDVAKQLKRTIYQIKGIMSEVGAMMGANDEESAEKMSAEYGRKENGMFKSLSECFDDDSIDSIFPWLYRMLKHASKEAQAGRTLNSLSNVVGTLTLILPAMDAMNYAERRSERTLASIARWSRLDPVKELAFQRRREMPAPKFSRAEAIRRMEAEIVAAAREAGEPLTGADPKTTITDWFRKAGIK